MAGTACCSSGCSPNPCCSQPSHHVQEGIGQVVFLGSHKRTAHPVVPYGQRRHASVRRVTERLEAAVHNGWNVSKRQLPVSQKQ